MSAFNIDLADADRGAAASRCERHDRARVSGRVALLGLAAIVLGHVVAFRDLLSFGFLLDDWEWLRVAQVVAEQPLAALQERISGFFRPLVAWFWSIAVTGLGLDAHGHYVLAVATGCLVVACVFLTLLTITNSRSAACLASLWFATHPAHVQVTAWLSARTSALLFLTSWVVLLGARHRRSGRYAILSSVVMLLFYSAALLTKEEAAVLALLAPLPLLDNGNPLARVRRQRMVYLMMWLLLAGYLVFQWRIQSSSPLVESGEFVFGWESVLSQTKRLGILLAPTAPGVSGWLALVLLLIVLGLPAIASPREYGWRTGSFALAALLTLLPTAGFRTCWFACRYYYLGTAMVAIALVVACRWYAPGWRRLFFIGACLVAVSHNAIASRGELAFWRCQEQLGMALTKATRGDTWTAILQHLAAGRTIWVDSDLPVVVVQAHWAVVAGGINRSLVRAAGADQKGPNATAADAFWVTLNVAEGRWVRR